jgi:5-methylcytosine-specific restriction endonuclease McrA
VRRPYKGRQREYDEARRLREEGLGYRTIDCQVGVPWMTVKDWVQDIAADRDVAHAKAVERRLKPIGEITSKSSRRMRLAKERGLKCQSCGLDTWMGEPITLEVHHLDGDPMNNSVDNLLLLCPNCQRR